MRTSNISLNRFLMHCVQPFCQRATAWMSQCGMACHGHCCSHVPQRSAAPQGTEPQSHVKVLKVLVFFVSTSEPKTNKIKKPLRMPRMLRNVKKHQEMPRAKMPSSNRQKTEITSQASKVSQFPAPTFPSHASLKLLQMILQKNFKYLCFSKFSTKWFPSRLKAI